MVYLLHSRISYFFSYTASKAVNIKKVMATTVYEGVHHKTIPTSCLLSAVTNNLCAHDGLCVAMHGR